MNFVSLFLFFLSNYEKTHQNCRRSQVTPQKKISLRFSVEGCLLEHTSRGHWYCELSDSRDLKLSCLYLISKHRDQNVLNSWKTGPNFANMIWKFVDAFTNQFILLFVFKVVVVFQEYVYCHRKRTYRRNKRTYERNPGRNKRTYKRNKGAHSAAPHESLFRSYHTVTSVIYH